MSTVRRPPIRCAVYAPSENRQFQNLIRRGVACAEVPCSVIPGIAPAKVGQSPNSKTGSSLNSPFTFHHHPSLFPSPTSFSPWLNLPAPRRRLPQPSQCAKVNLRCRLPCDAQSTRDTGKLQRNIVLSRWMLPRVRRLADGYSPSATRRLPSSACSAA